LAEFGGKVHTVQYVNLLDPIRSGSGYFSLTASRDLVGYGAALKEYLRNSSSRSLLDFRDVDYQHYWIRELVPGSTLSNVAESWCADATDLKSDAWNLNTTSTLSREGAETFFGYWITSLNNNLKAIPVLTHYALWVSQSYRDQRGADQVGAVFVVFALNASDEGRRKSQAWGFVANICRDFIVEASHVVWREGVDLASRDGGGFIALDEADLPEVFISPKVAKQCERIAALSNSGLPVPVVAVLGEIGLGKAIIAARLHSMLRGSGANTVRYGGRELERFLCEGSVQAILDGTTSTLGYILEDVDRVADASAVKSLKELLACLFAPRKQSAGAAARVYLTARPYLGERLRSDLGFDDDFVQRATCIAIRVPRLKEDHQHVKKVCQIIWHKLVSTYNGGDGSSGSEPPNHVVDSMIRSGLKGNHRELQVQLTRSYLDARMRREHQRRGQ
jgi:hypothetical protein